MSGQALEFKQLNIHAWEAFEKGHDVHMQAAPSQAELLYKNFKINKESLKSQTKDKIMEKYGNAAADEVLPRELLLGQSEREVEYDRAGRIIKGQVWTNIFNLLDKMLLPCYFCSCPDIAEMCSPHGPHLDCSSKMPCFMLFLQLFVHSIFYGVGVVF